MYQFTAEESVFASQLAAVRIQLAHLVMEERTQEDRLLTILRGHGEVTGLASDPQSGLTFDVTRKPSDGVDYLLLTPMEPIEKDAHPESDRVLRGPWRPGPCL